MFSWLAKVFASFFSSIFESMQAKAEAEQRGALEQERAQKEMDDARIAAAERARDAVDPVVVRSDDPDFRD